MKQFIITALILLLSQQTFSQKTYQGTVTDQSNNPLIGTVIIDLSDNSNTTTCDTEGNFSITITENNKISVSYMGFVTKTVSLQDTHNTIRLSQDNITLDEVLVTSASREIQKRSEIPGAIASISGQSIEDTKPFGIDQMVNQVPGVFMSTSRAASNEQHFMAVRSPISTKALFLYLEDGIQIRPTSVFNHNALLEMNDISYGRIEVLKGPASSIYGSESIGGSFNFITKNPTEKLSGGIGFQTNDIGLSRYELEVAKQTNEKFGFYFGGHHVRRVDGPVQHSDYEKTAFTFKTVYDISDQTKWTTVFDAVQYRSDMSGSISESDYSSGNYESDQTFTERDAVAFRMRTTVDQFWNHRNKTSFNLIVRDNRMDQNPSYRIRQFRDSGQLTGFGSGEVNSNQFRSFVGLVQHKLDFDFANSSLIAGATLDYSPQKYIAETTNVFVDTETGQNIDFSINSGEYILNYEADIMNYAGFFQYEIAPIEPIKITAALRYDAFDYDYDNLADGMVGVEDSKDSFNNLTPKLGVNYNFNSPSGVYANYSQGFTPPQVSTLYRNRNELRGIRPSRYHNYEIGGYSKITKTLKFDGAIYLLEGKNTLITLRDEDDNFFNTNAGKTQSYGIEYGISYQPIEHITLAHQGSYAQHRYVEFFDRGVDYSDTDRETAPNLLGTTTLTYRNQFKKVGFDFQLTHEMVGSYNTSFENQVPVLDTEGEPVLDNLGNVVNTTATYDGHHVFNAKVGLQYKGFEIWGHALNIFDEIYAARASYNRFRGENSYTIGNPLALHLGLRYNF